MAQQSSEDILGALLGCDHLRGSAVPQCLMSRAALPTAVLGRNCCVCVTVFSHFLTVVAPQVSLRHGSHLSVL